LREGDPLPDHWPFVRLLLLPGRANDRRAAGVRAWLRLRLLDGLVRAGGAGEWWRRGASRGLGGAALAEGARAPRGARIWRPGQLPCRRSGTGAAEGSRPI